MDKTPRINIPVSANEMQEHNSVSLHAVETRIQPSSNQILQYNFLFLLRQYISRLTREACCTPDSDRTLANTPVQLVRPTPTSAGSRCRLINQHRTSMAPSVVSGSGGENGHVTVRSRAVLNVSLLKYGASAVENYPREE